MLSVNGSLKRHLKWWQANIKNDYIVDIVNNGYRLPLLEIPVPSCINNNKSARDNADFVDNELLKLLESGVIKKLAKPPTVVNALSVAINVNGKKRLVLDLRNVNPLLLVNKFKYEDINVASAYFKKYAFMTTFDLKSGYHHIQIHEAYQQYLGFKWNNDHFCYRACPFGLATAGIAFSKVLRELVRLWRTQGIAVVLYLDDGLITGDNYQDTADAIRIIKRDLEDAGYIVNMDKTVWLPQARVKWLGFLLDSHKNTFIVPADKLARLKASIKRNIHFQNSCSARELAKTVGKICSLYHAYGHIVYMQTKACARWISERENWSNWEVLSEGAVRELKFWGENLHNLINMPLVPVDFSSSLVIYSDASSTGCGALVNGRPDLNMIHPWNLLEITRSSTWREIEAIRIYLAIHKAEFKNLSIKWYTDNKGVTSVLKKGSMCSDLNVCALQIHAICVEYHIDISIDWVPREKNEQADALSKGQDHDDWAVHDRIFKLFNKTHGPFTLDPFASNLTKKTAKFFSRFWCEGSAGVDGLAYSWKNETVWVVPPPRLIPKILVHMKKCKASGIMVLPRWQSAIFWPLLNNGKKWAPGISVVAEYQNPNNFFIQGTFGNDVFSEKTFKSNVLVLKVNYRE